MRLGVAGQKGSVGGADGRPAEGRRHNDAGVAGLKSQVSAGRARALAGAQVAELRALVIEGPDPDLHQVVRWRCVDLRAEVARRFGVTVHESTVGKWLNQLRLTRRQPRTFHPKKDAAEQAFETTSPAC